jgi:hypothetical protein
MLVKQEPSPNTLRCSKNTKKHNRVDTAGRVKRLCLCILGFTNANVLVVSVLSSEAVVVPPDSADEPKPEGQTS